MAGMYIIRAVAGIAGGLIAAGKGRSFLVWSLLCFVLPLLIIVILFLPSIKISPAERRCPACRHPLGRHEDSCSQCGRQKPIELVRCKACGSFLSEHETCTTCSRKG